MRLIQPNYLVPDTTYYIQLNNPPAGYSGKIMGEFVRLDLYFGAPPISAFFRNLRNIPNSRLPSGMGTMTNNAYNILTNSFFLPEIETIINNVINRRTNLDRRNRFNDKLRTNSYAQIDDVASNIIAKKFFPNALGQKKLTRVSNRRKLRKKRKRTRNKK